MYARARGSPMEAPAVGFRNIPSSFIVEGYRYLNGDAKALVDSSLYIRAKLYTLRTAYISYV